MGLAFFKASRYNILCCCSDADVAQEVEHFLGKEEVAGRVPTSAPKRRTLEMLVNRHFKGSFYFYSSTSNALTGLASTFLMFRGAAIRVYSPSFTFLSLKPSNM